MRTRLFGAAATTLALALLPSCGADDVPAEDGVVSRAEALFECNDPGQRFTCSEPSNPNKRFVCHATGSQNNPYVKISVPIDNPAHVPGVAHPGKPRADQSPGASGNDVGSGPGLDCECEERICAGICTGAPAGTACDDGDKCTTDGSCLGDVCEPGPPSCTAGAPVDACNIQSGACDSGTGACATEPLPAGTPCGTELVCDGNGECIDIPHVVLNEVESSGGVPGDWVELYNAGSSPANVSGWKLLDNDDTHVAYVIPQGTVIPAGGYLVLDEASFGFGLGAADSARLFDASSTLVDSHTWTSHAATTYGRCPNGTGAFKTTTSSTKGGANDCAVLVKINEVESSGGVPGDWVELYNAGPIAVDVSGWIFKDNDDTHAYAIPAGTTIAAGAYYMLEEAAFGFGLGAADSARLFDTQATLIDSHTWTAHAATTYGRCPNGTGAFKTTTSSTKGNANDCGVLVKINEVESSGGVPGDWVELYNAGPIAVDVSGWIFKDNDDTHAYAIPVGTTIAAGAYYMLEEAAFGFGLGAADSARLFDAQAQLIDSHTWSAHAATTYGRCPNGSGPFETTVSPTKAAANACSSGPPAAAPWPGANAVTTVDGANVFGTNLSGLFYEGASPSVLWAVRNGPSTLYRLVFDGSIWTPEAANGWDAGKTLRYPSGTGSPDAEDVTKAELSSSAVYVATERDNDVSAVSRLSILRFDSSDPGAELTATHEWNLNADLPAVGSNLGLEAITWVPDGFLVAHAFFDEAAGHVYAPADYPNHGAGLFFVGLEANGTIYAYALDHVGGGFTRVATIASGDVTVKALSFDRDVGYLWTTCSSACANQTAVLVIDATGKLVVKKQFASPSTMPNLANEGIAIAPESECASGQKSFFWSDDGQTGGHAIRRDSIPCGAFIP